MKCILPLFFVVGFQLGLYAQSIDSQLYKAGQFEQKGEYEQALKIYQDITIAYPKNEKALCKTVALQVEIGELLTDRSKKQKVLHDAYKLAVNVVKTFPHSPDAYYVMGLTMAKLTNLVSIKEKMKYVKGIKDNAEMAISIQPNHVMSLYLLGKWNMEIAALNPIEKSAINLFLGGLPKASIESAIFNFEKIKKLDPTMIANYFDLAKAYQMNNQIEEAKNVLKAMSLMPTGNKKDSMYKVQALKLLETL